MAKTTEVGAERPDTIIEESRWTKLNFWLCALHLFTLCSLAFAKPVFDVTAKEAAFFVIRGSRPVDILSLIAVLSLLVPGALVLFEALARLLSRRAQILIHFVLVGVLTSVFAAQFIKPWKGLDGHLAVAIIVISGLSSALLYSKTQSFRRLLSLSSVFAVIIPAYFVFGSPVAKILLPGGFTWTDAKGKSKVYLKKKPPIVFLVLDELPIVSLLDAKGEIDAKRFPNLAAFAATSHWYRNTTSVSPTTEMAVPAILTGIFPKQNLLPNITDHPNNIFTLLADNYKFNVYESACYLCPENLTTQSRQLPPFSRRLRLLIEDVAVVYLHRVLPEPYTSYLPTITNRWGNFLQNEKNLPEAKGKDSKILGRQDIADKLLSMKKSDRPDIFRSFISNIDATRSDTFNFIHILLPHGPFEYLPSTSKYQAVNELGLEGATKTNDKFTGPQGLVDQYHQLHMLQLAALDKLVGELVAKLKSKKMFDESLIVMVADHGTSFRTNDFNRELSDTNAADIMFVPLFFKLPGQQKGEVEDLDAETIDVVPTIADYLGVQLPWKASGTSLLSKDRPTKSSRTMSATDKVHTYPLSRLLQLRQQSLAYNARIFGLNQQNSTLFWFGDHLDVLGKKVSDFQVKHEKVTLRFEQPHLFNAVDLNQKLFPSLIKGELENYGRKNPQIAISINGVIQATTTSYTIGGKNVFTAVVPEEAFRQGPNEVDAYIISHDNKGLKHLVSAKQKQESFALKNGNLVSTSGTTYRIVAATLPGLVDELQPVAKDIAVTGWAGDLAKTKAADLVVVFIEEKFALAGRTAEARPDVSKALNVPRMQMCGFRFLLPPETNTKKMRVFGISDQVAFELNYDKSLGLKPDYLRKAYSEAPTYQLSGNSIASGDTKYTSVGPEILKGSIDSIKKEGQGLVISGWAANVKRLKPVESIVIFSKGKMLASGETRILRPDVGKSLRCNPGTYLGFEYLLPAAKAKDKEELRIFAVSEGQAVEFAVPKKSKFDGPQYALQDDFTLSLEDAQINVYPGALQAGLEQVKMKGKKVTITGWAVNTRAGSPVDAVVFFDGEKFIGSGKPNIVRQDVSAAFKNDKLSRCGFDFAINRKFQNLKIFAVSGNVATELDHPLKGTPAATTASPSDPPYVLSKDEIVSSNGDAAIVHAEALQGSADLVTRKGDSISIDGWAANTNEQKPAALVLAFYDNVLIASSKPRVARLDVGKAFNTDKLDYCGYSLSFPASRAKNLGKVRLFAMLDGAATELNNAVLAAEEAKTKPAGTPAAFPNTTTSTKPGI